MKDLNFTPVDQVLTLTHNAPDSELAPIVAYVGDTVVAAIHDPDAIHWTDVKALAYLYLDGLFKRDVKSSEPFTESMPTLITNTLSALAGRFDFLSSDWAEVKLSQAVNVQGMDMYIEVTTPDGYDLNIKYMIPGSAWQELDVTHSEPVPTPSELYRRLTGAGNTEMVTVGSVFFDGLVYQFDASAQAMFTNQSRLVIMEDGGNDIFVDENLTQYGLINVLLELHRKLILGVNYGDMEVMDIATRTKLAQNLNRMLNDMFGLNEFTALVDGLTVAVRGSVNSEVNCMITHTFVESQGAIRVEVRFFTGVGDSSVEISNTFGLDQPPIDAATVYQKNEQRIRAGLGLLAVEQPADDLPWGDNDMAKADLAMVVATGPTGGIGIGSDLLFRIKEDLKFFRETTTGHVVIMGRKTFESIGRPLANRINIVITRDPEYVMRYAEEKGNDDASLLSTGEEQDYSNLLCATSKEEALLLANRVNAKLGGGEIFVIGGGEIYDMFMDDTNKVYLTSVNSDDTHADVFFPLTGSDIPGKWNITVLNEQLQDDSVQPPLDYSRYLLTRI